MPASMPAEGTTDTNLPKSSSNRGGWCYDTLFALLREGPLWDGDVPSKSGRDELIDRGWAIRVIHNGADGYTAATYAGRDALTAYKGVDALKDVPGMIRPPQTPKQRLALEQTDNERRLVLLSAFIKTNPVFATLTPDNQAFLMSQCKLMVDLNQVLKRRLEIFVE